MTSSYNNQLQPEPMRERYSKLPKEILELFEYGTVDLVLENIVTEYGLSEEQSQSLRMEVELTLYLFLPRNTLLERLVESLGMDREEVEMMISDLEENLFVVVDPLLTATEKKFSSRANVSETNTGNVQEEQTPTPNESQVVKTLRTFSDDMHNIHGYGSFKQNSPEDDGPIHRSEQSDVLPKSDQNGTNGLG